VSAVKPSIALWIDPQTQQVRTEFTPQQLTPAQYGVVISSLMLHIARLFLESNKDATEGDVLDAIAKGINAGLEHRDDMVVPSSLH